MRRRWSADDELGLRQLWGTTTDAEVALRLGRSVKSVRSKATEKNLRSEKGRRAGHMSRQWTTDEDRTLMLAAGSSAIAELLELLPRRNRSAIESRCRALGFSPTQGTNTRRQIERDTGYDWRQLQRAKAALRQEWKRYGSRWFMVTDEQVRALVGWLGTEKRRWSRKHRRCRRCGTSGSTSPERHTGRGLCRRCWDAQRYRRRSRHSKAKP